MNSRRHDGGFEELEALIYRLFAEKQFALALLALVMVAQLLSAQFLLLRLRPPSKQATAAPSAQQRLDVRCEGGAARTLSGEAACLSQVTSSGASELVVGIETDGRNASN